MLLLLLLACGPAADTGAENSPPAGDATLEDVLAGLPACEPGSADGRLDLWTQCADGACPGSGYDTIVAALGEEPNCYSYGFTYDGSTFGYLSCDWSSGIGASFPDDDLDGVADDVSSYIDLGLPWDGGTTDGLALGIPMSCFYAALGEPDAVSFSLSATNEYLVDELSYLESASPLTVDDSLDNETGDYLPDGLVDGLTLFGF